MEKQSNSPNSLKTYSDLFFRYLFSGKGCEPITRSFINAVMTDAKLPSIISVDVKSPFNLETYLREKESILDVIVEDEAKQSFHIEVQVLREDAFIERCLYYNSKIYSTQLVKGENYTELRPVISIVLTAYDLFPNIDRNHLSFVMMAREIPGQILSEYLQIHFLQLPKISTEIKDGEISSALLEWLKFFNYPNGTSEEEFQSLGKEDEGLRMAVQTFKTFQDDPVLRDLAERREKFLLDVASAKNTAIRQARAEGFAEGETKGKAEGKAEGELNSMIKNLLLLLEWNIMTPSEALRSQIANLTDIKQIDHLCEMVGKHQVSTIEEFEEHLHR